MAFCFALSAVLFTERLEGTGGSQLATCLFTCLSLLPLILSLSKGRGEEASLSIFGPVGILLKCFLPSCLSWSYCWSDMENLVKQDFHCIAFTKYVMSDQWSLQGSEEGKALEMKCILGGISLLHPSIPLQSCGALNLNVRSRSYLLGTKRNRLKQGGTIKQTC